MTKKFKNLEKKSQEDSKISLELKKRHDVMQKKAQIATKEKADQNKQLKALYTVFQKQRKALELSIKKNKKFQGDLEVSERSLSEQNQLNMSYQHKIEALEQQREGLQKKHQRDMESLNLEVQDKKLQVQRQQSQISDL